MARRHGEVVRVRQGATMTARGAVAWAERAHELLGRAAGVARQSELLDLVLPRECGGCLRAGYEWCPRCARALAALALATPAGPWEPEPRRTRTAESGLERAGGAPWVVPHHAPEGMPPVHTWGIYADPLRALLSAWKDGGRRDLRRVLEPVLASSMAAALADVGWGGGVVVVIPAPSSRRAQRHRGDTPIVDLCRGAAAAIGGSRTTGSGPGPGAVLRVAPALRHVRHVEDQSGLGTAARRGNLTRALTVKPLWHKVVRGRRCLLVDDVVTTGATLAEAARALRAAGAGQVVGVTMAATQRIRG